jgi:hypothetical protein
MLAVKSPGLLATVTEVELEGDELNAAKVPFVTGVT